MSIFFVTAIILGCCLSILSLGIFLGIKIFNIPDITTDGSYTFGAVITGVLMLQNISLFIILPLSILGGAIAGCFTGFIHTNEPLESNEDHNIDKNKNIFENNHRDLVKVF